MFERIQYMRPYLLLFLLAGLTGGTCPAGAQTLAGALKADLLPLADPFVPGLGLTWQHRLSPGNDRWYLEHSLTTFFPTGWSEANVTRDLWGFRLRTSLQRYGAPFTPGRSNQYWGLMTHLQWSDRTMTADFRYRAAGFNRQIRFRRPQTVLGLYFLTGFTNWWSDGRVVMDFGFGAGPRVAINNPEDLPTEAFFVTNGTLYADHEPELDQWTLGFVFLFRVGYVFMGDE